MNLFDLKDGTVTKTNLTTKLYIGGENKEYPIYKIDIDKLYYNDQNDRIASWLSEYKESHDGKFVDSSDRTTYNDLIEKFIISSNPSSLERTQNNIELIGQRVSGVCLKDGRIIDGNRRFTCIRRLALKYPEKRFFEAVILDLDIVNDKKMIKLLELNLQHGVDKPVDYNNFEKLIGIYNDIIETKMFTAKEYASSINSTEKEVNRSIRKALIIEEFLEYINLPKMFHIVRERNIVELASLIDDNIDVDVFNDLYQDIKHVIFMNFLLDTYKDLNTYFKNLQKMIKSNSIKAYIKEQLAYEAFLLDRLNSQKPTTSIGLLSFVNNNSDLKVSLIESYNKCVFGAKKLALYDKPKSALNKSYGFIRDIDINIVNKLNSAEKAIFDMNLGELCKAIVDMREKIDINRNIDTIHNIDIDLKDNKEVVVKEDNSFKIIPTSYDNLVSINNYKNIKVDSTYFTLGLKINKGSCNYVGVILNKDMEKCSDEVDLNLTSSYKDFTFTLEGNLDYGDKCYLAIRKDKDKEHELNYLFEFDVYLSFSDGFDF